MNCLDLYSEPYGSTGNIGENFRRLLGAPSLSPLQTVIRESVQNIADAAQLGQGPKILIRLRTLTEEQKGILDNIVFNNLPLEANSHELLKATIERPRLLVLEICDFRTIGLGGPTRSDRIPVGTERTDFINFLRDIGTPKEGHYSGGTYGFGKVALYRASRCCSIIVDTLPTDSSQEGRRLIGCHVGRSFDVPDLGMRQRFTGRHWWGIADQSGGITDPLTGSVAAQLAENLGFPKRPTSGTSIMIVDFDAEEENLQMVGNRIVEVLLWNFWPRMMRDLPDSRRFTCTVEVEGSEIHVPKPEDVAPFDLFCKAMRAARMRSGNDVRLIESLRPAKVLGTLAIERGLRSTRRPLVDIGSVVPQVIHHIALMRPVELVVKYLPGNPLPDERLEWAGVFIASSEDDVEHAFASAEPPAHDDWIPDYLPKGSAKSYVTIALRRLRAIAAEMGITALGKPVGSSTSPLLARLAARLGAVLEDVGGDGAGRYRPSRGSVNGLKPQRPRATKPIFYRLEDSDKGRVAVFTAEVIQDKSNSGALLRASASIAIDGISAGHLDVDIVKPTVLSIKLKDCDSSSAGPQLELHGREGLCEMRVLVPDEYAVTVDVDILT